MSTPGPGIPIGAGAEEQQALAALEEMLHATHTQRANLIAVDGDSRELPETVLQLLHQITHCLAQGQLIALLPVERQLTTQQAADILNVSRPYVVQLLERGAIPFTKTGAHRRVKCVDLIAYKERRDDVRRKAVAEITRLGEILEGLGRE